MCFVGMLVCSLKCCFALAACLLCSSLAIVNLVIEFDNWTGVVVPAGTPKEIIAFLNREIGKVIALPEMRERFIALGFDPVGSSPEDFDRRCKVDFDKWRKLIQAFNIKPE
jgi:tripartite-type tricarboxylate transporter receptor subunit TctC